jgi:hypothetical protein
MTFHSRKIVSRGRHVMSRLYSAIGMADASFDLGSFPRPVSGPVISSAFDAAAPTFQQQRFVYIEEPIEPAFHARMLKDWPQDFFLEPAPNDDKVQNIGFKCGRFMKDAHIAASLRYLNSFPAIREFYDYLRSSEFEERARRFMGVDEPVVCYYSSLRTSKAGGWLTLHMDGVGKMPGMKHKNMNIVWHINGVNGSRKGGLCLYSSDKNFDDRSALVHESTRLKNSCLIYDMTESVGLYHGYPPMDAGAFRWVITSQFLPLSQIHSKPAAH